MAGALEEVGAALLAVWRRNARSARLATPLLRLADTLLAGAGLGRLQPPASAFPGMWTPGYRLPLHEPCMFPVHSGPLHCKAVSHKRLYRSKSGVSVLHACI